MKTVSFRILFLLVLSLGMVPAAHAFVLVSDFNDGTLQGWTAEPPFNGTLTVQNTGGNPGGFALTTDTVAAGGGLLARAPAPLTGDLSIYDGLQWDEFVYDNGDTTTVGTSVILQGSDGTQYQSDRTLGPVGSWNTKSISFLSSSDWILKSGTGSASFDDVVSDLNGLFLSLDTSTSGHGNKESGIDNVVLLDRPTTGGVVPEPATMSLLGIGILGAFSRKRKE
jgi:hypothetical protein